MGRQRMHTEFSWEYLLENIHLENGELNWRITLNYVFLRELDCEGGKWDGTGLGSCPMAGFGISDFETKRCTAAVSL
jgi:hypothetical protein